MRIPAFCICKNKGADQLHSNHAADQRFCFRYIDSTIPLFHIPNAKFQDRFSRNAAHLILTLQPQALSGISLRFEGELSILLCQNWAFSPFYF